MSRERLLMLIGIFVLVSPFVGLPLTILTWILPVLGGITLGIGASYAMRKRQRSNLEQHAQIISHD
jgi:cytochrome c-type biogenesis protein CcmH/NrfF